MLPDLVFAGSSRPVELPSCIECCTPWAIVQHRLQQLGNSASVNRRQIAQTSSGRAAMGAHAAFHEGEPGPQRHRPLMEAVRVVDLPTPWPGAGESAAPLEYSNVAVHHRSVKES